MATLATIVNWFFAPQAAAREAATATPSRDLYRLRPVANEDIYFFVKSIDNSSVVREADPQSSGACWKLSASACVAVLLLIGVLLPSAYGLLAGYQVQALKQEQERLVVERSGLELDEAKLLSPKRLEEMARTQAFIDPAPNHVVYLEPKSNGSLAMNVRHASSSR